MSSIWGFQLVFGLPILFPPSPPWCMPPKCLSPASDAKTTDLYHDCKWGRCFFPCIKGKGLRHRKRFPWPPITDLTKSPICHLHYCKLMKTQLKSELQKVFQINPILIYFFFSNSERHVVLLCVLSGNHSQAVSHVLGLSPHPDYEQKCQQSHDLLPCPCSPQCTIKQILFNMFCNVFFP